MTYKEQLLTKQWLNKKNIILKRDNYECKKCKSLENLQVHHIKYISKRKAWEVPNNYLITLCKICHEKEHDKKNISSFFINEKQHKDTLINKKLISSYIGVNVNDKNKIKTQKMRLKLKGKDREIQKIYDLYNAKKENYLKTKTI